VNEDIVKKVQSILGWPATLEQVHKAMQYVPDDFVLGISATGTPMKLNSAYRNTSTGMYVPHSLPMADPY